MYNMLIVDDNPADRQGISKIFDWGRLGIHIAGTCHNGRQALEYIKQQEIDLVLTDIAMPLMNGIELAMSLKKSHPDIKVIFMSCFSDFKYAKSAVDLDAYGYVLKPIIPEELRKTVLKLLDEYRVEETRNNEKENMLKRINEMLPLVREQFFRELLLGNICDMEEIGKRMKFLGIEWADGCKARVSMLNLGDYEARTFKMNVEDKYLVSYTVKDMIETSGSPEISIHPIQISSKEFVLIFFISTNNMDAEYENVLETAVRIHNDINEKFGFNPTMGISKPAERLNEIHHLYKQACDALGTSFFSGSNPVVFYEMIEDRQEDSAGIIGYESLYKEIKDLVNNCGETEIDRFIGKYIQSEGTSLSESYIKNLTFSIVNLTMIALSEAGYSFNDIFGNELVVWEKLSKFKTIINLRQWLHNFFRAMREYLSDRNTSRSQKVVDTIKSIIRQNYREQLSLDDISKAVYLSPGYANSIFKKETGRTIFDYLLEYRIEVAKKLLVAPDSKVTVVSEEVGYFNKSYFCLMFKKYAGMSPSEYKSRALKPEV